MDIANIYFISETTLKDANLNAQETAIKELWDKLNTVSLIALAFMFLCSIGAAIYYYTLFNNRPGRHYKPSFWKWTYLIQALIVLAVTAAVVFSLVSNSSLNSTFISEIKIVIINTGYSLIPYLLLSWFWCQFEWPTNAYRYVKF